ncbi:hypothetical protein BST61_g7518 [Cercospora zeina]
MQELLNKPSPCKNRGTEDQASLQELHNLAAETILNHAQLIPICTFRFKVFSVMVQRYSRTDRDPQPSAIHIE